MSDDEGVVVDDDSKMISLDALLGDAAAISDDDLEAQRARAMLEVEKVVINEQNLNGVVSDNTAIDTVTGHNAISGEAFTGAAGFVSSIQNTGNNVLIQSSTIVNVTVEP
ncbi:MAG: carbon storage regulator [Gammaproteobacteria bacterium]|nr:carbon storage regulator [Gammaproteobacteria bacterium]